MPCCFFCWPVSVMHLTGLLPVVSIYAPSWVQCLILLPTNFLSFQRYLFLFLLGRLPGWLMLAIVCRDFIIVGGTLAWHFRFGRVEMAPSIAGKLNTFLQISMIFLVLVQASGLAGTFSWLPLVFYLVFLTTVISGIHYIVTWGYRACMYNKC